MSIEKNILNLAQEIAQIRISLFKLRAKRWTVDGPAVIAVEEAIGEHEAALDVATQREHRQWKRLDEKLGPG